MEGASHLVGITLEATDVTVLLVSTAIVDKLFSTN